MDNLIEFLEKELARTLVKLVSAILTVGWVSAMAMAGVLVGNSGLSIESGVEVIEGVDRLRWAKVKVNALTVDSLRIEATFVWPVELDNIIIHGCSLSVISPAREDSLFEDTLFVVADTFACRWQIGNSVYLRFDSRDPNRLNSLMASATDNFGNIIEVVYSDKPLRRYVELASPPLLPWGVYGFFLFWRKRRSLRYDSGVAKVKDITDLPPKEGDEGGR